MDCSKDLWTRFPEFKKHVIELQKKYFEEEKTNLLQHKAPPKAPKIIS
jgi:hypothetical protein